MLSGDVTRNLWHRFTATEASTSRQNQVSKVYRGPLVKIIILLPACSVSLQNTVELNTPWADVDRVFQRPFACMSDLESNQIYMRTKSFLYLGLRTEQN